MSERNKKQISLGKKGLPEIVLSILKALGSCYPATAPLASLLSDFQNQKQSQLIEDTLNFEALIFTLAICIKQLSSSILHNTQLIQRIINIVNFGLGIVKSKKIFFRVNNYCYKYILNIIETFLLSRSKEELSNDKD